MVKTLKMLTIILIIAMVFSVTIGTISMASSSDSAEVVGELFNGGSADTSGIKGFGANVVDIITTIGIIVAVVVLLVLGIKYMMGSAAEKAEYKKTMIPYLIGAVLIFGAAAIAKAVIAMSETITSA